MSEDNDLKFPIKEIPPNMFREVDRSLLVAQLLELTNEILSTDEFRNLEPNAELAFDDASMPQDRFRQSLRILASLTKQTTRHWMESGGMGAEVITRLMGYGAINNFPSSHEWSEEIAEDKKQQLSIKKHPDQKGFNLQFALEVNAPLDGRETWTTGENRKWFLAHVDYRQADEGFTDAIADARNIYKAELAKLD